MSNKRGVDRLRDRRLNKSVAFTKEERKAYGLIGLLPYSQSTQTTQMKRVLSNIQRKESDIEKYVFLSSLQERNERLYYNTIMHHMDLMMPLIYTPTVGQACKEFSQIWRHDKGFYITPEDKGQILEILDNWPEQDIRVIVVTDGERILGLGDLGANGMGIPIGKLALYCACAGIQPHQCLPVIIDVGTNNMELLDDILYLGYPKNRITGEPYFDLVDEFIMAVQQKYPKALIQFEDFLTPNAYALLEKYRDKVLCFNDDIQGTASVALAGIYASQSITHRSLRDSKIMFLGAGSAATGIADLIVLALQSEGLSITEAMNNIRFVDINGLLVEGRTDLMAHNQAYAVQGRQLSFKQALKKIQPNILIGASGAKGMFTKEVIEIMSQNNERPVIFALSNPTSKAECTAQEAYTYSKGRVVFASGSPFKPLSIDGQSFRPGQGNNAYIFPGIGLAAVMAEASKLPESIFLTAARVLADQVSEASIAERTLYPPLQELREVSIQIAIAVIEQLHELGLARVPRSNDLRADIEAYMYDPSY